MRQIASSTTTRKEQLMTTYENATQLVYEPVDCYWYAELDPSIDVYAGIAARFEDYAETLRVFDKSQLMSYLTMFEVFNENFFSDKPIAFTEDDLGLIAIIKEQGDESIVDADNLHALKNKLAPYYDRFINQVTEHYEFVTLDDGTIVTNIEPVQ